MQYPRVVLCALVIAACSGDDGPAPLTSLLPEDYEATFTEVRNCRRSADHDLNFIRVVADADAAGPYMARDAPFPVGAVIVKEEFDPSDDDCSQGIIGWTVMVAQPESSEDLGWAWQRIDELRDPIDASTGRCVSCHTSCGVAPDGYLGTCAVP